MASSKPPRTHSKPQNKQRRQSAFLKLKRAHESAKRAARFQRKREEAKNPALREERRARNVPATIDSKRVWDDVASDDENMLGRAVDVERLKRQKKSQGTENDRRQQQEEEEEEEEDNDDEDELDSMLDEEESGDDERSRESSNEPSKKATSPSAAPPRRRQSSPGGSTASTNLALTPEALASRFPTLFSPPAEPKILITTSMNSTLHAQAEILTTFFPNSVYIRRSRHHHGHKYSVREIARFAANRSYTTMLVLEEDQKRPCGLTVVHLPQGPTFHFSISNWVEGKKLPGHGNPTDHLPELILNNFRTPLGLLTAHLFRAMYPPQPELQGRQVVTLHNQRDYIFVRRHRYIFRDKRPTEKSVVGSDGKPVKGVEEIRAGLQELGPRFTLKLRRVDKGIQRRSGQEWEWKGRMDKERTRFQL
ncbi:anticodon-binding protein [Lineolata rhizophorae]|uniref:Anticodon-binding protein n=1 Tax=Lineolata rhizophorae TaxID=578093 RepID=A0A6A6P004_9PEZI|nr:anticodon-binding protein [Lineolata rhizophorae]